MADSSVQQNVENFYAKWSYMAAVAGIVITVLGSITTVSWKYHQFKLDVDNWSRYSLSVDNEGALSLEAHNAPLVPHKVIVTPLFLIRKEGVNVEVLGSPLEPFERLMLINLGDKKVIKIRGVLKNVCNTKSNSEKCNQNSPISQLRVDYFFSRALFGPRRIVDYAGVGF